jgi:hypothetical protein
VNFPYISLNPTLGDEAQRFLAGAEERAVKSVLDAAKLMTCKQTLRHEQDHDWMLVGGCW